jgi:hypothetical protein
MGEERLASARACRRLEALSDMARNVLRNGRRSLFVAMPVSTASLDATSPLINRLCGSHS